MNIQKRINALRSAMAQKGIDIYIIPTADFHHSEYVGDYFKFREYMTGFTGSAGTAVFTSKKAGLWTDGRYFIQAERQMGENVTLFKMREPGVPTVEELIFTDPVNPEFPRLKNFLRKSFRKDRFSVLTEELSAMKKERPTVSSQSRIMHL